MSRPIAAWITWTVTLACCSVTCIAATLTVEGEAGTDGLETALGNAVDGDTIRVLGGRFDGPLTLDRSVVLIGEGWPVIDGGGHGTIVTVAAPGVTMRGFSLRASGKSLTKEDTGLSVVAGGATVEGNRIEDVLFGVYLKQADGCVVRDNRIVGYADLLSARRGDLIRAWYSKRLTIEGNLLEEGRDLIVWFSEGSVVRGNTVSNARYGIHFMYDVDCEVSNNTFVNNSVGAYFMYSRRLVVEHNVLAYNRGPSGFGIGLKDLDDTRVVENLIVDNRVGVFVDNSPREVESTMEYEGNVIAYNDQGVRLGASAERSRVTGNSFMENYENVTVPGGGRAPRVTWNGNYWSDYSGFDSNGDGVGDVPYRSDKLFEDMLARHPRLRLFVYSPAVQALNLAAVAFPVVRPQPRLVDNEPRLSAYLPSALMPLEKEGSLPLGAASAALVAVGLLVGLVANLYGPPRRRRWPDARTRGGRG